MAFDPKEKQTVNKTIRIDEELAKKIYEVAGSRKLSFNKFVVQCIEYAMDNIKDDKDD